MTDPRFGQWFENTMAGERNPNRFGMFVRKGCRTGRVNPGVYYELTDGKGKFWQISPKFLVPAPRRADLAAERVRIDQCAPDEIFTDSFEENSDDRN